MLYNPKAFLFIINILAYMPKSLMSWPVYCLRVACKTDFHTGAFYPLPL